MKTLKRALAIMFTVLFLLWIVTRIFLNISFDRDIGGYLSHAAAASTIQLAKENLDIALKNIECKGLTSGYTSVLFEAPEEDIGFWYKNLKASRSELNKIKTMSFLEQKNVLAELRKTLFGYKSDEPVVVIPRGISVFPNNRLFAVWGIASPILALVFWLLWVTYIPRRRKDDKRPD